LDQFKVEVGAHPELGKSLPPISPELGRAPNSRYVEKRTLDINKRYSHTLDELLEKALLFEVDIRNKISAFKPLLTDADAQVVLPATCAMSYWKPTHTDLEEMGQIAMDTDFEYSKDVADALYAFYKQTKDPPNFKLSLPRGKNIGWPTVISGTNRTESDVFLLLHATLAIAAQEQKMHLSDLFDMLRNHHGDPFLIWASRTQHTDKWMPCILKSGLVWTRHFEPRVRGIFMSPKCTVAFNRIAVKRGAYRVLHSPLHDQDRPAIKAKIKKWFADGWSVYAVDYSKYERHVGGKRAKSIIDLCARVSDWPVEDLLTEFNLPILMFGYKRAFLYPGGRILGSGLSSTSLIGSVGNAMNTLTVMVDVLKKAPAECMSSRGSVWDSLLFGDDGLVAFPPSFVEAHGGEEKLFLEMKAAYAKTKMKVDREPLTKYLGYIYGPGTFKGSFDEGYPTWRAVQQQFYPERLKVYPFTTVGYIARLELLGGRGRTFHDIMQKFWNNELLGPAFSFNSRMDVFKGLLPEIEKKARDISQLDDILQSWYHGVADPDLIASDFLADLVGLSYMTIDDPVKQVADLSMPASMVDNFAKILKGDFSSYNVLMGDLVRQFSLQWKPGDVLY
jgi:hypothetical protein